MEEDFFCPRHGRRSRPIEVPGLRCDCAATEIRQAIRRMVMQEAAQICKNYGNDLRADADDYERGLRDGALALHLLILSAR